MALIGQSYAPPGTYTATEYDLTSAQLNSTARIPVLIGEGQETFTYSNVELHRGSSATADDQVVGENISDQVTGSTRTYQLTYFPVVAGDGSGTVTNDPTKIKVTAGGLPVNVVSLNGATGQFQTQSLIPLGTDANVTYYFKKKDTYVANENASGQVPAYATLAVGSVLNLSLSTPGFLGNNVALALTLAAQGQNLGVADAQAVTGQGTDAISIELRNADDSVRTYDDILALIQSGIQTSDGGYLTASAAAGANTAAAASAMTATHFTNGSGQSVNNVFKTNYVPVVDGTNGGVVTTDVTKVVVKVNGVPAVVTALDGANGLITLAQGVTLGSTVELSYFTNRYQDTADLLPSANVDSIMQVGYGPDQANFIAGTDFVLSGNTISWGAAAITAKGQETPGYTPFDASVITTTLVDEKVYLRPVIGAVSGRNSTFTLEDTPVDGSGLGVATDNPSLISVYVGTDPISALLAGSVRVLKLSGAKAQVTLYNPPAAGQNVYATYYRSALNDHTFTMAVKTAGAPGQGTYTITDEQGKVAPLAVAGAAHVTNAAFNTTGLVWPHNFSDLTAALGAANETITLTFQDDGLSTVVSQAVQASLTVQDTNGTARIKFTASTPGTAGNNVTITLVGGPTGAADASAISVTGSTITVETVMADNTTVRTWQQIVSLFATYPVTITGAGTILCTGVTGADLTPQATSLATTNLAGGAAAVTSTYANRYRVTTSRTAAQAAADGLGLTGGATTPSAANTGSSAVGASGYLGQTYIDAVSDVKFTIVDPQVALSYGFTQLPSPSYQFKPGDTLTFVIDATAGHVTGTVPTIAIPGLQTKVVTTLNMHPTDTATIATFNRAGNTPNVGDYYYVTYTTKKTAADMSLQFFSAASDAYAVYGQPSVTNRLSLAAQLLTQNGAQQFGCIQVPKDTLTGLASDQDFVAAINTLANGFQGSGRHVDVIVPLSTSATVAQALNQFLNVQATPRNQAEAIGFIGFDQYTSAATMQATAQALNSKRIVAVAPTYLGINIKGPSDSTAIEYPVTGEFAAAALAGLSLAAGNDVATSLTRQSVVGFTRTLNTLDTPTMNLLATAGITVLVDAAGALMVRHYRTTAPKNSFYANPYVTTSIDYVNQSFRKLTDPFIGRKRTEELPSTIQAVLNAQLGAWKGSIIDAYGQVIVTDDPTDPTSINVQAPVRPMFSLDFINITTKVTLSQ